MKGVERAVIDVMRGREWLMAKDVIESIRELSDFIGEYENMSIYRAMDNLAKKGAIVSKKSEIKKHLRMFMLPEEAAPFGMTLNMAMLNKYLREVRV